MVGLLVCLSTSQKGMSSVPGSKSPKADSSEDGFCCCRFPSPLDPEPMNCILSPTISVVYRSLPSLSCHFLVWSRPTMCTCLPFARYSPAISACRPQRVTLCHSVFSSHSPDLFLNFSDVANEKEATAVPDAV